MTNQEAIDILRCSAVDSCDLCGMNVKHGGECDSQKDFYIALDKAIEALEKQEQDND